MAVATSSDDSTVGVRDLKNHLSAYLDRVKAGEEITVPEHGRPIARLTAFTRRRGLSLRQRIEPPG